MFKFPVNSCALYLACCGAVTVQSAELTEPQTLARFYAKQGRTAHKQERLLEAVNAFTKSLDASPDYRVYIRRAMARIDLNQHAEAIEDLTRSIELNDDDPRAYLMRGLARKHTKDYEQAISDCTRALELEPNLVPAYIVRGGVRECTKEYEQAISDYTRALELDNKSYTALLSRVMAWIELERYRPAINDIDRALELEPNDAFWLMTRAKCWFFLSDIPRALSDVEQAIKLEPDTEKSYYLLRGDCKLENKDFEGAVQDYDRALEIESNSKQAMFKLAQLLSCCSDPQFRNLDRAHEIATRACVSTQWKDWEMMLLLSAIQVKKGEGAAALLTQEKALDAAPAQHKPFIRELMESESTQNVRRKTELSSKRRLEVKK